MLGTGSVFAYVLRISEHRDRVNEVNLVFLEVDLSFRWIPIERQLRFSPNHSTGSQYQPQRESEDIAPASSFICSPLPFDSPV
jgi:hypothetical protein